MEIMCRNFMIFRSYRIYFSMRRHQIFQPEFNDHNMLVGLMDISLFDMGDVLSPFLEHDDVMNFFHETSLLFATGPGADIPNINLEQPHGLSAHPEAFPQLLAIINAGGYTRDARNRIRNILGFNILITPETHGNFVVTRMKIYFHCDFEVT